MKTNRLLSATSKVVANDPYELRIVVPSAEKSWRANTVKVSAEDSAAGVKAEIKQDSPRIRANITSPVSRDVKWTFAFERGQAIDILTAAGGQPEGQCGIQPHYAQLDRQRCCRLPSYSQ